MSNVVAAAPRRTRWLEPSGVGLIFACGSALFSDGYQNAVVGPVNTLIKRIYAHDPDVSAHLGTYTTTFSSTGFAGTVVGMLVFGVLSDRIGRKTGMILATVIVFVFAALAAGAYAGGSIVGMLNALAAYRFLGGIGIGAEYPSGSVAAAENTEDPAVNKKIQHGLFAASTNSAIDIGFVIANFVPLVMIWIFGEDHLRVVWRMSLGLGCIPPLLVLIWRMRMAEPASYQKYSMKRIPLKAYPWKALIKKFGARWLAIALAWWIYDFIAYPFGIYSSTVVDTITNNSTTLTTVFAWNVVINAFYLPGTFIGALVVDRVKPKRLMIFSLIMQAVFGFIMSAKYSYFSARPAAFAVMYGIFLSWGEAGPGNCLGMLSSKSSPTAIRGIFYGTAAAMGKIGAFAGTWAFPAIIARFPKGPNQDTGPFWIGSGLAILSALIILVGVHEVPADHMKAIDEEFYAALQSSGFDVSRMGLTDSDGGGLEHALAPETLTKESGAVGGEGEAVAGYGDEKVSQ